MRYEMYFYCMNDWHDMIMIIELCMLKRFHEYPRYAAQREASMAESLAYVAARSLSLKILRASS